VPAASSATNGRAEAISEAARLGRVMPHLFVGAEKVSVMAIIWAKWVRGDSKI
jgi:hypothetical protein